MVTGRALGMTASETTYAVIGKSAEAAPETIGACLSDAQTIKR
jgi:hypothetical protein